MQPKNIIALASVTLLVALAVIWWEVRPAPTHFNRAPIVGLGQVLAEETARAVQDRGNVIVVVVGNPAHPVMPGNGLWDGFQDELKKHKDIRISAKEFVNVETGGFPVCSTARFKDIWEHHRAADAIVFFVGVPDWFVLSDWFSPRATPKILVVDTDIPSRLRYRESLANGLVSVLIGIRGEPITPSPPKTPREWFGKTYQVYTAQNSESLPD